MKNIIEALFRQYNIQNISCDSRSLKPHDVFFAIDKVGLPMTRFIYEALTKVDLVITNMPGLIKENIIYVQDIKYALSTAINVLYTALPKNLVAVTGTNGKTSVVSYIYQILELLSFSAASIGTLGIKSTKSTNNFFLDSLSPFQLTTPSIIDLRKILNQLSNLGIDNVAFEASSHGIHQQRLNEIKVKTAGFVSFSQDHLDYHQTMEEYLESKLQLFVDNLFKDGMAVISFDILQSKYGPYIKSFFKDNHIKYCTVGKSNNSPHFFKSSHLHSSENINIIKITTSLNGTDISFEYKGLSYNFHTKIIGSFQASNLLIAAKIVQNLGLDFSAIFNVLEKIRPVDGRLERASKITDDVQVFVDYAHTPEALLKSLSELKKVKQSNGKLYVIFGCGGNRDTAKRSIMGEIAQNVADHVVITDDNPRDEDPATIRRAILEGANSAEEIADRQLAIKNTIEKLKKNDILLIAGKGHENYQIVGEKILQISDIEIANRHCLERRLKYTKVIK